MLLNVLIALLLAMSAFGVKVVEVSARNNVFLKETLRKAIPKLSPNLHKGQMGRVGVVGGSADFTGAPYYAGEGSLKFGGDLCYIFCAKQAAIPIKSYSPELMVTSFYDDDEEEVSAHAMAAKVIEFFPRLHSVVIGPGLGRKSVVMEAASLLMAAAREQGLPLILDADALYVLTLDSNLDVIKGYKDCILSPNQVEFARLVSAAGIDSGSDSGSGSSVAEQVRALARSLGGPTILLKGASDLVCGPAGDVVYEVLEGGSMRRCGGQGDVLAGALGTAFHWANMQMQSSSASSCGPYEPPVVAAFLASIVTKKAAALAFSEHWRSTTTPDILTKVGPALVGIEGGGGGID